MFNNPYCVNDEVRVDKCAHCYTQRKGFHFLSHMVTTKRAAIKRKNPQAAIKDSKGVSG
tara:strand:- start:327 stop:503 length:177 start_codon:yes stop_codon:yes gene_type:complete